MAIFTTLTLLTLGGGLLYGAFSLVSFVAHWTAIIGAFAFFGILLRYLIEERPIEVTEEEVLDNILYLVFSLPVGILSFRLLETVFKVLGIAAVVVIALIALAGLVYPPALYTVFNIAVEIFDR